MVDPIARFTSLELAAPVARTRAAPAAKPEPQTQQPAQPKPAATDGVDLRLSAEAQALLGQIAAARGEKNEPRRPAPPGSRVNIVI